MLYGQGGLGFSFGFRATLGSELSRLGHDVSYWYANTPGDVIAAIRKLPTKEKLGLIGYSNGANGVTWAAGGWGSGTPNLNWRTIDLMVGYDPTVWAPLTPIGTNVKRAICYHQTGLLWPTSFFGRAQWTGHNVEVVPISMDHLYVQLSPRLHAYTIRAVQDAAK
jgi:hypothetical protein